MLLDSPAASGPVERLQISHVEPCYGPIQNAEHAPVELSDLAQGLLQCEGQAPAGIYNG